VTVLNPSAHTRSGLVELVVPAEGPASDDVQVLSERAGLPGSMILDADTVRTVLGMLQGPKISDDAWIHEVRIEDTDEGLDITIAVGTEEKIDVPIAEAKQDVYTRLGARPDSVVRVAMDQPSTRRILARTGPVAGYGWAAFSAAALEHPVTATDGAGAGAVSLSNGLVSVEIDGATGTFSVDGVSGYGRLVDEGDLGDSYNYSPPRQDSVVDAPTSVTVRLDEQGPVRGRARITSEYRWPDHIDGGSQARVGEHTVEVTTDVEVRADESIVRVTTSFVNPSGDHRLRVLLPLPEPTDHSEAESAYAVVTRGLTAEGRSDEFGLPTAPAQRFVRAGGLTVAHEGVTEYELIDIADDAAHTIALTVLRSTGMLSRLGMAYRPFPAGPLTPVEGLQMRGKTITFHYALAVGCDDAYALADDVLLPLETVSSLGGGSREASGHELAVHGAQVSALHRVGGVLEVRVFNPTAQPTVVSFAGRSGWLVDLRGYPLRPFEATIELGPFGIATARLHD
jgi:mannosylglycerate hydrolase